MSGNYAYPEHMSQELMRLLSASGTDAYPERKHQFFDAYAQHMRKKIPNLNGSLRTMLSTRVGTDACTEHVRQELMHPRQKLYGN